ncbi:hypothetical protein [Saccharothrix saharensis]|uniref:hypothetical protein n=1 Tax=Saccharothrix saharensis TaxID=571190 RepID=UPI00147889EF|nr:hypothetical protein [Saccharothrix saharensis]
MGDLEPRQRRLPGEEREGVTRRLTHSCYRCGHRDGDLDALAEHEDQCAGP